MEGKPMNTTTLKAQLKSARAAVNSLEFGSSEWDQAMATVRQLVDRINEARPAEVFCSVDSGVHPTRLQNGRLI
jgi:hypothetical protein